MLSKNEPRVLIKKCS